MSLLINILTAWITVVLMVLLLVIYALRIIIQKSKIPKDSWIRTLNRKLRKPHKWLGVTSLFTGFIHGLYSSVAILTTNKGTILWLLFILLGLTFMLRKQLKNWRPWIQVHRIVATLTILFLFLHLVEVEWFVGVEPIIMAVTQDLEAVKAARGSEEVTSSEPLENAFASALKSVKDGVYRGEAMGYRPGLIVDVTVKDQRIELVEVVDHNEVKKAFWGLPVTEIPLAIVERQSIEVDMISGATMTSYGIIRAVEDAIMNADRVEESDGSTLEVTEIENDVVEEVLTTIIEDTTPEMITQNDNDELVDVQDTEDDLSASTPIDEQEVVAETPLVDSSAVEATPEEVNDTSEPIAEVITVAVEEEVELDPPSDVENVPISVEEVTTETTEEVIEEVPETAVETIEEVIEAIVEEVSEEVVEEDNGSIYNDGLYIGTADGFRPNLVVEVVVHEGRIFIVEVIDHNEVKERYWGKPVERIPKAIIEHQTTDVDVISGATYTSYGIMDAVDNALEKALK